jgi:hypothetical protein
MLVQGVVILFTVQVTKKVLQRHLLLVYIGQLVNSLVRRYHFSRDHLYELISIFSQHG